MPAVVGRAGGGDVEDGHQCLLLQVVRVLALEHRDQRRQHARAHRLARHLRVVREIGERTRHDGERAVRLGRRQRRALVRALVAAKRRQGVSDAEQGAQSAAAEQLLAAAAEHEQVGDAARHLQHRRIGWRLLLHPLHEALHRAQLEQLQPRVVDRREVGERPHRL